MSILAIQREKDPSKGYATDFLDMIRSLIPFWKKGLRFKLVTNAGGLNPQGCAEECRAILEKESCTHLKIGVVSGDDVLSQLVKEQNPLFNNIETGRSLQEDNCQNRLITANVYLGAAPIVDALNQHADIVITGRVADPSLTVGPCIAHFEWALDDYNKIAGATVAGHLIECGTQVTGGISTDWLSVPDPLNIGFPFVEVSEDGSFVITKPTGTGGVVNLATVKEQLLYEIGDPARYLSPDVTLSFLSLELIDEGKNRVKVDGAVGTAPPPTYKVSASYRDGFKAEATLALFGRQARKKAQRCGELIFARLQQAGYPVEKSSIECLGTGDLVPGLFQQHENMECMLRLSAADPNKEPLEQFTKEIAPLVTSGPQGTTGYLSGRSKVRPVFGYWPCLISREQVKPKVRVIEVTR